MIPVASCSGNLAVWFRVMEKDSVESCSGGTVRCSGSLTFQACSASSFPS